MGKTFKDSVYSMAKYNQLLRIEEELGDLAVYGYKRIK